jgi:transcriptional regulator with XRE-family HTH domain
MPRKPPPKGHILYALGAVIRRHRLSRGHTQEDVATLVGVSIRSQRKYEAGLIGPPYDTLVRLAYACDMPLSAFVSPLDGFRVPLREVRIHHTKRKAENPP